jgi:hypothetical protein
VKTDKKRDALGHREGCLYYDARTGPPADPSSAYVDLFCDCHESDAPEVGANGTDVIWPAHWTEAEARYWRYQHGILRRGETPPYICPRCRDEHWTCIEHGKPLGHDDCRDLAGSCPVSNPRGKDAKDPTLTPRKSLADSLPKGIEVDISWQDI